MVTCAVVFGVCFVIVPFAHSVAYAIHTTKNHFIGRSYTKLYSSDETLDGKKPLDGFINAGVKPAQPASAVYESDVFDETKLPAKVSANRHKRVDEIKESKRTRRRTNSGCYSKLDNLPDSDI